MKIKGTIDGHPFRSSFMAMGNGSHMLPVKADVRKRIGKDAGDSVSVHLNARIDRQPVTIMGLDSSGTFSTIEQVTS